MQIKINYNSDIKQKIRKSIKSKIINLPLAYKKTASDLITNQIINLLNTKEFFGYLHFGCYWPQAHEFNTLPLINYLLNNHKYCYLPVINKQENTLDFIEYRFGDKLIPNKFGILEPEYSSDKNQINLSDLQVIFVPSIAFNHKGNRLGSGLGYYDRTLNKIDINNIDKIKLIGIGFFQQMFDSLEFNFMPDPWDVNLNYIITDQSILATSSMDRCKGI